MVWAGRGYATAYHLIVDGFIQLFVLKLLSLNYWEKPGVMFSISDFSAAKPEHVNDIFSGASGKELMKQNRPLDKGW